MDAVSNPAATSDVVRRGDELQYELDEGPCLDSVREQETHELPGPAFAAGVDSVDATALASEARAS